MSPFRILPFLFLACLYTPALSCPALCKCYARRAEVVCNEVPMTEYPSESLPKNTTMLTIQYTNITSISERHLNATPLLQGLHLYSNHLQNLSSHLLRGVPHLHTLDLTGNRLSELPANVFGHAQLRFLVLKNNRIKKVDTDWLPDNSNLTWLDLSGNHLTKVPTALLQKLPHLENLDLSNNRLEKISTIFPNSFSTKLEKLSLQRNKLDSLDVSVFQGMPNLTYLFLTHNKLEKLPQDLFRGLKNLKHLSLEDNQLVHVPLGLLDPLDSLDEGGLDLTANPFQCDENMEYLWRWLQKNKAKVFLPETIACAKPASLSGRFLFSLTEKEINLQS